MHHMTHIENLEGILEKGLVCRNNINLFKDTANSGIVEGRGKVSGYDLNDYVPFHLNFFQKKHGIGYNYEVLNRYGRENMLFIVLEILPTEYKLIYSLYHPTCRFGKILDDFNDFSNRVNNIYVSLLGINDRLDYTKEEVQQFLKSEVLVYNNVKVSQIKEIYVYTEVMKKKVEKLLEMKEIIGIEVIVNPSFYRQ